MHLLWLRRHPAPPDSRRGDLTTSQLDLAKEFDPVDPTAWLYSSLQKLRSNRPVEALQDFHEAAQKNRGLPIFRSRLPLDTTALPL